MPAFASDRKSTPWFAISFTSLLGNFLVTKCLAKVILRKRSYLCLRAQPITVRKKGQRSHTSIAAIERGGTLFLWCREESGKPEKPEGGASLKRPTPDELPLPGPALQMIFRTQNRSISLEFKPWVFGGNFRFKPKHVRFKHSEENDIYSPWFQQIVSFLFKQNKCVLDCSHAYLPCLKVLLKSQKIKFKKRNKQRISTLFMILELFVRNFWKMQRI